MDGSSPGLASSQAWPLSSLPSLITDSATDSAHENLGTGLAPRHQGGMGKGL